MAGHLHSPSAGGWRWAFCFALVVAPLVGWVELLEPFGRDQGIHATIAYALRDGLITYRDVFNMKPPLTTGVHLLSQLVFGHSMMAIRALDLCFVTLTALGMVAIGRGMRLGLAFGFAAPLSFVTLYYSYGFWEHAQTDGWAGMLVVGALWLMVLGWARTGHARLALMIGAGVLLGLAFGLKYTIGGAGILVFAPRVAAWLGHDRERFRLSDLWAVILGGLAFLAALLAAMAAAGALDPFLEIQNFIRGYLGYGADRRPTIWDEFRLIGMPSTYLVLGAVLGAFLALVLWRREGRALPLVIGVFWVAAGLVSGHVQGKGFQYHYLPLLPAYAFLTGIAVSALTSKLKRRPQRAVLTGALLLALFVPSQAARTAQLGAALLSRTDPQGEFARELGALNDFDIRANLAFADELAARDTLKDGLFVWGYATMLYFLVNEPPRYRYPYAWPFVVSYYDGRYTQDLLARLRANPPGQFVVQRRDATPWVTDNPKDSEQALADFPSIQEFLHRNYELVLTRPRFKLYERTGP